jgi:hypothetical protein
MITETSQPKRDPYTGDPSAKFTLCAKKLRRHLSRDLGYVVTKSEPVPVTNPKGMTVFVICRHCKRHPYLQQEADAQA